MKKVIRLTESDLNRIVKKVIKEQPLEDEIKYITLEIPESIIKHSLKLGISEHKLEDMFEQYVKESLGFVYGMGLDYFMPWAEEPDNIDDYKNDSF